MFYGEILRLRCTLNDEINHISTSEMYFEFSASGSKWTIKEGLNVSSRSIEADVNITEAFVSNTRVNCQKSAENLSKPTFIHVYSKLNMSCRFVVTLELNDILTRLIITLIYFKRLLNTRPTPILKLLILLKVCYC